jgi:uncharacterized phage protein gp47/JayE
MTFIDGNYEGDSSDEILDTMISNAKQYWEVDIKDDDLATIRLFYRPIADLLSQVQGDIGLVLESTQIDNSEGQALDLLTALIGVSRDVAKFADGSVTFSRDSSSTTDYIVPSGTTVQTDSSNPETYSTTEQVTLSSGTTSVSASIDADLAGASGNTAADTVTVMPNPPTGVQSVTNPAKIDGGQNIETDEELRTRAKEELSKGSRASAPAILNNVLDVDDVVDATVYVNDTGTDNTGSGGLPDHSFEVVAAGGVKQEIAQRILETKAAGDESYGGANGTLVTADATLSNGQTLSIDFSRPGSVKIYIDIAVEVKDNFAGTDAIIDNIIDYIGGTFTTGNETQGKLRVGEDVLFGEVEYAIRNTNGVYDVTSLEVDTSSSPTGTSNIAISQSDLAIADGTDTSLTVSTTQI